LSIQSGTAHNEYGRFASLFDFTNSFNTGICIKIE
jgi:hypothetical protein